MHLSVNRGMFITPNTLQKVEKEEKTEKTHVLTVATRRLTSYCHSVPARRISPSEHSHTHTNKTKKKLIH